MKTNEAKKTRLDAGLLSEKYRPCLVVHTERQEVRLKLHRVAFGANAETVRPAFREYSEDDTAVFCTNHESILRAVNAVKTFCQGLKVVILSSIKLETFHRIREGHLGVAKCRATARRLLIWLDVNSEVKNADWHLRRSSRVAYYGLGSWSTSGDLAIESSSIIRLNQPRSR
ncbi:hypothetical protein HPB51_018450 [Rhipicephalus microplus]|uniref:Uncharacterized protein n=1 Tax=Rhipicephalus microplus TaxID=6941 RepID=A0A9J6D6C9_RHIMP|nr:hypothetical protein HPB51_018450 [Rhipicephalus microplus]